MGAEYILIYARSSQFTMSPVYRGASEERQNAGYWKGFWNAADRPTMRYELLGVVPDSGQWKWKQSVAREAIENYHTYLRDFQDQMTIEEYWELTGKTKRFIRRQPDGRGKNLGVEHWVPPSTGILRSSNWTDLLASETLAPIALSFDNPKNVSVLKELIRLCCDDSSMVLDFFAGSCATAHAILDLNSEDGGNRRFIMIQLPEPMVDKSEFSTIADLGRERIRRVIHKIQAESESKLPLDDQEEDLGFKVFKLSESNFRVWDSRSAAESPEQLAQQLELYVDHIQPHATQESILYEILLKSGFELTAPVEKVTVEGRTCYSVAEGLLLICLEDVVTEEAIRGMIALGPQQVVCLDSAFHGNDHLKTNTVLQMRDADIVFHTV